MGKNNHHKAERPEETHSNIKEVCDCVVHTKHRGTAQTLLNIYKSRCRATGGNGYNPNTCYIEGTDLHLEGVPTSCLGYLDIPNVRRIEKTNIRKVSV